MKRRCIPGAPKGLSVCLLAATATAASANAGTPLMWLSCGYLLVGNFLIGRFEAWVLQRMNRSFVIESRPVIAGNYASMLCGIGLIYASNWVQSLVPISPLRYGMALVISMWVVAFGVSVLVEAPFVRWALEPKPKGHALWMASLKANAWSYLIILPLFWVTSPISLLTHTTFEPSVAKIHADPAWVYFIADSRAIRRIRTDGAANEFVQAAPSPDGWLSIDPDGKKHRALLVWRDGTSLDRETVINARLGQPGQAAPFRQGKGPRSKFGMGTDADFLYPNRPRAGTFFYAWIGLHVGGRYYALDTPFLSLNWRQVTTLPNGTVIAGLGDEIVLFDPDSERISVLVRGRSPAVLLDRPVAPQP